MTILKGKWDEVKGAVAQGGEPPHDGGMEARIAKLESDVAHLQVDVGVIRTDIGKINDRINDIAPKIATLEANSKHTATKAWVLGGVITVLVALVGACWWIAQQYLGPILAKLAS